MNSKMLIKILFAAGCLLLTGCTTFATKTVTRDQEIYLLPLVPPLYTVVPGTLEYQASSFENARYIYGQAYKGAELGYILIERTPDNVSFNWASTIDKLPSPVILPITL